MFFSSLLIVIVTGCVESKGLKATSLFEEPVPPAAPKPTEDTGTPGESDLRIQGLELNSGFGSAVLVQGVRVWVGAPHGEQGVVYRVKDDGLVEVVRGAGRLGSSLAMGSSGLEVGAPLRQEGLGAVVDGAGNVLVAGKGGTGLALASGSPALVAHGSGYSLGSESITLTPGRPTSISILGTTVGVGMARGEVALLVGSQTLSRPEAQDEAGFALAAGDLDGDGGQEWVIGAPGSGAVHIVDPDTLEIRHTLRSTHLGFGFALAVCDLTGDGRDDLLIGAPRTGLTAGAGFLFTDPMGTDSPALSWFSGSAGDRLGSAVGCSSELIALGAPGTAVETGHVRVIRPSTIAD